MVRAIKKLPRDLICCPLCKRKKKFERTMDLNQHLKKKHDYKYKASPPKKLDEAFSWILRTKLE